MEEGTNGVVSLTLSPIYFIPNDEMGLLAVIGETPIELRFMLSATEELRGKYETKGYQKFRHSSTSKQL